MTLEQIERSVRHQLVYRMRDITDRDITDRFWREREKFVAWRRAT